MHRAKLLLFAAFLVAAALVPSGSAASRGSWAAAEIRQVTQAGVFPTKPADFHPQAPLTQGSLAYAVSATDRIQHPPLPAPQPPAPIAILSTLGPGATVAGLVDWEVQAPNLDVGHVDFAIDGVGLHSEEAPPYQFDLGAGGLDTKTLADGAHQLAVKVVLVGGGYGIAVWTVTVANAASPPPAPPTSLVAVPVVKSWQPAAKPDEQSATHTLYRALSPTTAVTIKQLDAALVAYAGLGSAANEIQSTLAHAGLRPRPNTGTEAVARMLGLRLDHPASQDYLELLPNQPATRAEAAWSFAHVLSLDDWQLQYVQHAADTFTVPELTPWQQRILTTAVSYVGYPYVWGGTSPAHEVEFGVPSVGGFDCSGFVWRVYKLTPYAGERNLAGVLRGRTTYEMSGEVPHRKLIPAAKLQPADVMFFGGHGRRSSPSEVDHTALYLGNGWLIQSSGQGVTLVPFDGWYQHSYAWGRRPLREAGLE